jgi:hypothetical protein
MFVHTAMVKVRSLKLDVSGLDLYSNSRDSALTVQAKEKLFILNVMFAEEIVLLKI